MLNRLRNRFTSRRAAPLIIAMLVCVPNTAAAQLSIVQTRSGPVRGTSAGVDGVMVFRGLPYAAPPTGDRRWRPPAPPASWSLVRDATQFGPQCPQPQNFAPTARGGRGQVAAPPASSEDCLTLNVWTAAKSAGARLPVMVWIHGGGFTIGTGANPRSSAELLAAYGAVVITFNYRLGPLGFFAHPGLSRESDRKVSGDYGLLDLIAALRWVRDNIAAFGGNPSNVTVFGQSAGASSGAGVLMVSPLARGLFHRVIAQSAGTTGTFGQKPRLRGGYYGLPSAEDKGAELEPDIAKLRAMSADAVIDTLPNGRTFSVDWHFGPVIDGYVLPDDPGVLLGTTAQAKVPLLIGHNVDEAFFYRNESPRTLTGYRDFVAKLMPPEFVPTVLKMYPAADDAAATEAVLRMFSDFRFVTPTVLTARAASQVTNVYMYRFSRVSPVNQSMWAGAAHGVEIPYVFNHVTPDASQYEEIDRTLSRAVAGAWVQFAKTGNPNGAGLPQWPPYRAPDYRLIEFGNEISVQSNAVSSRVDLFRQISESLRRKPTTSPRR